MDKKEFCEKVGIDEQTFGRILELDFKDMAGLVSEYCVYLYPLRALENRTVSSVGNSK